VTSEILPDMYDWFLSNGLQVFSQFFQPFANYLILKLGLEATTFFPDEIFKSLWIFIILKVFVVKLEMWVDLYVIDMKWNTGSFISISAFCKLAHFKTWARGRGANIFLRVTFKNLQNVKSII
jgi:hypothetical protein